MRIVVWLEMPIVGSIDVLDTNQVNTLNTVRKRLAALDRFMQHEVQDIFDQFLHN